MKNIKVLKIIFISVILASLILFLTASLTSCCNIGYFIDKLNELRNKTTTGSYDTTTTESLNSGKDTDISNSSASSASIETLQNADNSNIDTSSIDKTAVGKKINFVIEYYFDVLGLQ